MINYEAFFKISYGLYVVCSGSESRGNGYISNTVFQVTSDPPHFATCCSKDNFTAGLIQSSGVFSVSVLHRDAGSGTIATFGYKSGKETNKLEGAKLTYGETGVPIVLDDAIAFLECRVIHTHDLGSHLMFIGELVQAEVLDSDQDPLTYLHYRTVKKGLAPKNAPTYIEKSRLDKKAKAQENARFECPACGYIYDEAKEGTRFGDLPENWICPLCGSEKEDFIKL